MIPDRHFTVNGFLFIISLVKIKDISRKMENIKDKVVIITGVSSGIGEETARVLAKEGAKLVLGARREDRLQKLAKR